jgi:hypothetical protein
MANVYNFFKFLEDKVGAPIPVRAKIQSTKEQAKEKKLYVDGNLNLSGVSGEITALPEGLRITGYLDLSNTNITKLPKDLMVGGFLNIRDTAIETLPADMEIVGPFYAARSALREIPEGINLGRKDIELISTPIKSLPKNFTAYAKLTIVKTQIETLPPDLKVFGDIYIGKTPLASKYTIEQIKEMSPGISEDIYK